MEKINTCTRFILDIIHVSLLCDFLHGDTKPFAKDQMTFLWNQFEDISLNNLPTYGIKNGSILEVYSFTYNGQLKSVFVKDVFTCTGCCWICQIIAQQNAGEIDALFDSNIRKIDYF